jgi:hypothetical protein
MTERPFRRPPRPARRGLLGPDAAARFDEVPGQARDGHPTQARGGHPGQARGGQVRR